MFSFLCGKGKDFNDSHSDTDAPRELWGAKFILSSALCTKNRQPTALVMCEGRQREGDRVYLNMNEHCMQVKPNLPGAFCERQEEKNSLLPFASKMVAIFIVTFS